MSQQLKQPIEAALLYDSIRAFRSGFSDWGILLDRINQVLASRTPAFQTAQNATNAREAQFFNGIFHISVTLHENGLDRDSFAGARIAPCCAARKHDLLRGLRNHHHAVVIAVGPEPAPPCIGSTDQDSPLQSASNRAKDARATVEHGVSVAQMVLRATCDAAMPCALHWGQTDHLFSGPGFCNQADTGETFAGDACRAQKIPDSAAFAPVPGVGAPGPDLSEEDLLRAAFRPERRGLFTPRRPARRPTPTAPLAALPARAAQMPGDPYSVMRQLRTLALGLVLLAILMVAAPLVMTGQALPDLNAAMAQNRP